MVLKPPKVKGYRPISDWERASKRERKAILAEKKRRKSARAKESKKNKRVSRRIWRKLI